MRRLTTIVAAFALALGLAVGAPAAAQADNAAVAVNTKDGSSVFRFAFAIRHVVGDVVDETNSAVAFSSCTDCSTTAIAIEIVLVDGSPSTFTPVNQAIAINYQCTLCDTFAAAYQFVIQGTWPMHFDHSALREMAQIRKAIRDLQNQSLDPFQLQQALDPLIARLKQVLATGLVSGPPPDDENDGQDQGDTTPAPTGPGEGQTSTEPAATATAPPSGTTTSGTTTEPAPTTATTSTEPTTTVVTGTTTTTTPAPTTTTP